MSLPTYPAISPDYNASSSVFYRPLTTLMTWLGLLTGGAVTWRHITATDFPIDMIIYREGVRAFLSGGEMYSEPMYAADLALPFIYPPFGALFLTPLAVPGFLSNDAVGNVMVVFSNLLILLCLWLILRTLLVGAQPRTIAAATSLSWAGMLAIEPVELNNLYAQINITLMALVVLDLVPRRRRWIPRGTLIGVAAAIKLTPLVFGLYFLVRRDYRAIFTTAVSAVTCTLLAALLRFDATVEFYFGTLFDVGGGEAGVDNSYQSNSSLQGMLMRWSPSQEWLSDNQGLLTLLWLVLTLVTIGAGVWLIIALIRRGMLVDAMLVNAVVMLLVSPVSWSHHWVWLALLIPVWAWRTVTVLGGHIFNTSVLAVWAVLLWTQPPKWWFGDSIDHFALSFIQKVLVSDYVWLAILALCALAVGLRPVSVQPRKEAERISEQPGSA